MRRAAASGGGSAGLVPCAPRPRSRRLCSRRKDAAPTDSSSSPAPRSSLDPRWAPASGPA
eukprot:5068373-Prymnesium_polylepis.1